MLARVGRVTVLERVTAHWCCITAATHLQQRHAHKWRARTLPVCWKGWKGRWMHAKAALLVVLRRSTKLQRHTLAQALRRWRVGSRLRVWLQRREHVRRRRCLLQVVLTWQHKCEKAVWKQHTEDAARNLFWARGQPILLRACFAAVREFLLQMHRARGTAMVLAQRRLQGHVRLISRRMLTGVCACLPEGVFACLCVRVLVHAPYTRRCVYPYILYVRENV